MQHSGSLLLALAILGGAPALGADPVPYVGRAVQFGVTPPLASMARPAERERAADAVTARAIPRVAVPRAARPLAARAAAVPDAAQQPRYPRATMPAPLNSFEGVSNLDSVAPPDTVGDVGPNHYLEMVNMHFCVYDKVSGTNLIAPMRMSALFAAAGFPPPASTTDDGDPIVLYDHLADRWLISQFIVSVTPCHEVVGISQTPDPTGAWYLYDFVMPNNKMNDYPHFGVWPDGYYMTDNQFESSWAGAGVFVFDRAKMLAGNPGATYQYFDLYGVNSDFGGMLPSDLDGPPPPDGTPNYFGMVDQSYVNPFPAFYIWEFHVDWTNPANSTFGAGGQPNYTNVVAAFDWNVSGVPQPGTTQTLDPIPDRIMHRLQYRCFGGYDSLVACHTVRGGSGQAAKRYYQFKRNRPAGAFEIAEQATYAPDGDGRWMGSAALDGQGNLAVGFSVSGTGTYPSIRYAGRLASDPSNGLFQGEATLFAGSAAQTGVNRWGDYSALSVDPVDDVTFWYCNEYSTGGWNWRTRWGSFRLGTAIGGKLAGRVTNALTGAGIAGATVRATNSYHRTTADSNGVYLLALGTGRYDIAATADGFFAGPSVGVTIYRDYTSRQDFALSPYPLFISPGAAFNAAGTEGGPFSPAQAQYVVSNAWLSPVAWSASRTQPWLDLSAPGGLLAPGAATTVTVGINILAEFLSAGAHTDAVRFVYSDEDQTLNFDRAVNLTIANLPLPVVQCWDFSGGLPAGWTVRTNIGSATLQGWVFNDPGGRGNRTGGSGQFAIADSDKAGTVAIDTELRTAVIDLRGKAAAQLIFKTDLYIYSGNEIADVDYSVNGAAGPWSNLWRRATDLRGPATVTLDLSAAAGQSNVMVRFHYYNVNYDWWWQVDDVCVAARGYAAGDLEVKPAAGLTSSGYYGGPFTPDRVYRLSNLGTSPVVWTANCSQAWLDVRPSAGSLAAGTLTYVTGTVNAAALVFAPGAYTGEIAISNTTAGLAETRDAALTVRDALVISPAIPLVADGLEGGPFTPSNIIYTLTNGSAQTLAWTSDWRSAAWLAVTPAGGGLAPGAAQAVDIRLVPAQLTTPGVTNVAVVFSNGLTGLTQSRGVTVTVVAITGEIGVYDSVPPTNDLRIPFGVTPIGAPRTEQITIVNRDPPGGRDLTVSDLYFGYYSETFASGQALGWRPDVASNWAVIGGEYCASNSTETFMTSVYTNNLDWTDFSLQAQMHRAGSDYSSEGVAFRVSNDFDADGMGRGYLFLLSYNSYSVFYMDGSSYEALQGWTVSTAIKTGTATNILCASGDGAALRLYINNTLVWTGTDARSLTGGVALVGYTSPAANSRHYFDNVSVGKPRATGPGLGRKQRYYNANAQPFSRPAGRDPQKEFPLAPGDDALPPPAPRSPNVVSGPFSFTNHPPLPAVLTPGASFTFDVVFAPDNVGTNENVITAVSDDNDHPRVSVELSGRAAAGMITGRVTAAHTGAGLAGATVTATNAMTNWTATTDSAGGYRLTVPVGAYGVKAIKTGYSTNRADVAVAGDGDTVIQDFVLSGSSIGYAPAALSEMMIYGTRRTNIVSVSNSGPLEVRFSMRAVRAPPADPIRLGPGQNPTTADVPSIARAPAGLGAPAAPGMAAPSSVPCYGINMSADTLVSFNTATPGTLTTISGTGTSDLFPCADFLSDDFVKLYALDMDANQLVWFNTASGARTVIGTATPQTGQSWTSLAGDPTDGKLYAASTDISVSKLYTINPATGAATFIGNINNAPGVICIAISPAGQMYAVDIVNDHLVSVNKTTGAGTVVGALGVNANYAQGMDFDDQNNILYWAAYTTAGELRVIDTSTGNSTSVGAFPSGAELCMAVAVSARPPWVVLPTNSAAVGPGATTNLVVIFDAGAAPNAASTNQAGLEFSGNYINTVTAMPLTMIVAPDGFTLNPTGAVAAAGERGGAFAPERAVYGLSNASFLAVGWTLACTNDWLSVSTNNGALAGWGGVAVTTEWTRAANLLPEGAYVSDLVFVNQATGAEHRRRITLAVTPASSAIGDLVIGPTNGLVAQGYQYGPFTPSSAVYRLVNTGTNWLDWTADATGAPVWLAVSPGAGALSAGEAVNVSVHLTGAAAALAPTGYFDAVVFSNAAGGALSRPVALTIWNIPGNIRVTDTIPPYDDRNLPFSNLVVGLAQMERITVANTNATYNLIVNAITFDCYEENFADSLAQGWVPQDPAQWAVVAGEYRAQAGVTGARMQSVYGGAEWRDCAAAVTIRRMGDNTAMARLLARASADFSYGASAAGDAYAVAISGAGTYYVGKYQAGVFSYLQGLSASPYLNSGAASNRVLLNLEGTNLQVYFNGYLAWSGGDAAIGATGRVGVLGFSGSSAEAVFYFDDFEICAPLAGGGGPLGPEQMWYNQQADVGAANPDVASGRAPAPYPLKEKVPYAPAAIRAATRSGAYTLTNLPAFPATVLPGSNFTFDVRFQPDAALLYEARVGISSTDAEEPKVAVTLSGRGLPDYLYIEPETAFTSAGNYAGPFNPTSIVYDLTNLSAAPLAWAITHTAAWVTVISPTGMLAVGGSRQQSIALNAAADALDGGVHRDTLTFSNATSGRIQTRAVVLTIAPPVLHLINAQSGTNGTVWPNGGVFVIAGRSTNFVIMADPFFHIAEILTNEAAITLSNPTNMTVAWSNVYADGTLRATFDANVTVYDTPEWWLNRYYPGTSDFANAALSDTDGDGQPAWAEFYSGTIPTNVLSVMKMVAGRAEPGGPGIIVQWSSVTNKRYRLERISDLKAGYFTNLKTNIPAVPPVNVETDRTTSGRGPWLYRIELER